MNNSNQGSGTEQLDHNADINNEVSPHAPIRSMLPSSTSLTTRRNERPNLNLDLSLGLYPIGSTQVEGMDGTVLANTARVLPSKRRDSNLASIEEFSTRESSRRRGIPQLGIANQQLAANYSSQANSSSYLTNQLANFQQSSDNEVVIGEGSFPNMQNQLGRTVPSSQAVILGMNQQLVPPSHANNSNNNLNIPSYNSTELANVHRSSEVDAAIGQRLVPYMPNQSHAPLAPRAPRARYIHAPRYGTRAVYLPSRPIPVLASMLFQSNPDLRARIMINQVRGTLQHLDTTGMQPMGPSNEHNTIIEFFQLPSKPDKKSGITEEEILGHVKRENFRLIDEEPSENEEKCVICQDEYVNGEEVGKLDFCVHRFHVNCIKQWLLIENLCPICKQKALAIDVDVDVDDHE